MKLKLAHKLGIILLTTVLMSALISALIVSYTTRSAFMELVRENDILAARNLARSLEDYYAQYRSWEGIREVLENPFAMMPGQTRRGPMGGMGHMDQMGPRPGIQERRPLFRIVLVDAEGTLIAHTFENTPPAELNRRVLEEGVQLSYAEETIGYLFVGSMIETAFGPFQRAFLFSVYRSILIASLIVGILLPLIGMLLMRRHITAPLQQLNSAAQQIAGGHYEISISGQRSDEIGALGRSFQRMAAELSAADEWKRKLISDSAHELRTPVSILQGNLEMMLEGVYPLDRERVTRLYSETQLLERLVRELQDLANAESKNTDYIQETIDLKQMIAVSVLNFKSKAEAKSVELQLDVPDNPVAVSVDRDKMKQVWANILKNAIHYSPSGKVVRVELQKWENGKVMCACEDDGPGIEEAEWEFVFERFYRIDQDRNRSTGGSGLGLAIVREIVRRHNGKVYFENPRVLHGARIVVELQQNGKN